jgi:hypothetical protein
MSVDLLPREEGRQRRLRRQAVLAALALVVLWVALVAASLAQQAVLDDRIAARDAVAQREAQLAAQVASLAVFQQMADDVAAGNRVLAFAMQDEVSWAQLLVDLSRSVPETASFTQVSGTLGLDGAPLDGTLVQPIDPDAVGRFAVSGYSREVFTPGLEDLLRRFGAIEGFVEQYLAAAQLESIGDVPVTRFSASVELDASARTGRYVDGLPAGEG